MAISQLTPVDITFLVIDAVLIALFSLYYYSEGNSFKKCRKIEISDDQLTVWRFFLYGTIFSTWLIAYLIFIDKNEVRHLMHLFFLVGVNQMLEISIPAYVCKFHGFGGTCNCDFYKYNDFYPMLILGVIGNFVFAFAPLENFTGLGLLVGLILISIGLYYFLPKKELQPLKYPSNLLISDIDQLQEYLMTKPQQKKLLTVLNAKCDFCEIQVEEILRMPEKVRNEQLRIFDLTFVEDMDPIIPMTLNMNMDMNSIEKFPVPTTFIFDSGMAIEQKDGVLSKNEIEAILMQ